MKIIQKTNAENPNLSTSYIEAEKGERLLMQTFLYGCDEKRGELFIPEGIEEIATGAFYPVKFHTIHFPKSLKRLGKKLFSEYDIALVKIIYPGTSREFMKIAAVEKEEVYESDGYDHYPYYSGNSRWATYYYAFDNGRGKIEVFCKKDGVTLLYGTEYRKNDEPPKIKRAEEGL